MKTICFKTLLPVIVIVALIQQQTITVDAGLAPLIVETPETCVKEVVEHLHQRTVPKDIKVLIEESRKYYPDFSVLLTDKPIVEDGYVEALEKIGPQPGCDEVIKFVDWISVKVPCYRVQPMEITDVINARDEAANEVLEADYVCQVATL